MSTLVAGSTYPPQLTDVERDNLVLAIKDWSIGNGLAIRPPPAVIPINADPAGIAAINAPVTLFPSQFPRICFEQGKAVQQTYNDLYAAVSRDEDFLAHIVKEVADGDDFIRNLWQIHLKVKQEGYTQPLSLGLFRSDYMVHQDASTTPPSLTAKQVEFNTIASSFGGLSCLTSKLHRYLAATEYPLIKEGIPAGSLDLPESSAVKGLAGGIEAAFNAYPPSELGHPKCIIFLVQGDERNVFDQRHLEYQIASSSPKAPVFRLAFSDILTYTTVANTPKRQLLYRLPRNPEKVFEVAVIYMRAGYGPGDYPDQRAWDARYHLERSAAIKCPTVLTQLAGTKKVQQVLATPRSSSAPSMLGRFINDDTPAAGDLWRTFTNIYPMDTSEAGLEARQKALDPVTCQAYVLKPQREGGGNNIYRGAIPGFLKSVPEEHWGSFILMELITPPPVSNLILRNGKVEQGGVICELGVYGTCLWNQNSGEVFRNEEAGYLLRTKGDKSEEGGVAAGYGCMDSCSLV
ncbi:Glutathione synthase [Purpureocillium takamizusanense]|uniref:Glutathione synthetase n=1 Tax=Purpureocillium takamizusanense TaxID=2060973 RepID=A0A9Q8V5W0_9HYPO|nr:Glutathione synthase [Purpureocillium takamizusanense]UNI14180.1 Glutathione synthase [Purpureocillium takamizusanense]